MQVLKDKKNNVKITTEFLKLAGGDHGGSWAARIKGVPLNRCTSNYKQTILPLLTSNQAALSRTSMIFYLGLEGLGGLDMETPEDDHVI